MNCHFSVKIICFNVFLLYNVVIETTQQGRPPRTGPAVTGNWRMTMRLKETIKELIENELDGKNLVIARQNKHSIPHLIDCSRDKVSLCCEPTTGCYIDLGFLEPGFLDYDDGDDESIELEATSRFVRDNIDDWVEKAVDAILSHEFESIKEDAESENIQILDGVYLCHQDQLIEFGANWKDAPFWITTNDGKNEPVYDADEYVAVMSEL